MKKILTIAVILYAASVPASDMNWHLDAQLSGSGITKIGISPVTGTMFVATASSSYPTGSPAEIYRKTLSSTNYTVVSPEPGPKYIVRTVYCDHRGYVWMSFWGNATSTKEKLYLSTNDGLNWIKRDSIENSNNIFSITVDSSTNYVYIGTRFGVKRSTDGGNSFVLYNSGYPQNQLARHLENAGNGIVFVSTFKGVYKSTNHGQNWMFIPGMNSSDTAGAMCIERSSASEGDNSRLYCTANSGSDLKGYTSDFGYTAIYLSMLMTGITPFSVEPSDIIHVNAQNDHNGTSNSFLIISAYPKLGGNGGVYYSTDGGSNFSQISTGLSSPVTPAAILYNKFNDKLYCGYFGNYPTGAKLWTMNLTVGVNQISSAIPSDYRLSQNYPNPFNPLTKISFALKRSSHVRIVVSSATGRIVNLLVDRSLGPGTYETLFDGTDLSTGLYFCKMFVDGRTDAELSRKMILVK